jgi:hypothetical protein
VTEETTQSASARPSLLVEDRTATRDALHMWMQIIGKIHRVQAPLVNHWWQVTLYVTRRGLTTSAIPCRSRVFDMEFDFVDHQLRIRTSGGAARHVALEPKPVADFYAQAMHALADLGIQVRIQAKPNEVDPAIPFAEDRQHWEYDAAAAHRFSEQLIQADRVMHQFRAYFIGKVSPVHFFWGAMDLACTRLSGRPAPERALVAPPTLVPG